MLGLRAAGLEDCATLEDLAARIFEDADSAQTQGDSAVIAFEDGVPVGYAVRLERRFHPHASSLTLGVLPEFRRRGIGTNVLEAICATVPPERVWRTLIRADRDGARRFLVRHGFEVMRQTWFADLQPQKQTSSEFTWLEPRREVVATLVRDQYIATHGINPSAEMNLETWAETFLDDALPATVRVLEQNGEAVATAALAPNLDGLEDALDVAFLAVRPDLHSEARAIVSRLVNELLAVARGQGMQRVILKADSTDPVAMVALQGAVLHAHSWLTLQTGVPLPQSGTQRPITEPHDAA
jgi:GNAT superfamily N-acetyltransferase